MLNLENQISSDLLPLESIHILETEHTSHIMKPVYPKFIKNFLTNQNYIISFTLKEI